MEHALPIGWYFTHLFMGVRSFFNVKVTKEGKVISDDENPAFFERWKKEAGVGCTRRAPRMVRQNSRPKRLTKVRRQRLNRGTPSMNRPVVRPCRGTVHEVPVRAYESQDQTPKDPTAGT